MTNDKLPSTDENEYEDERSLDYQKRWHESKDERGKKYEREWYE